jgi:hypothetical protein
VPPALAQLIVVNVEYKVLLYLGRGCCKAICPSRILDYIRKCRHTTTRKNRKQIQEYRRGFPSNYNYSTIELPADGLALQPVIPVVDRFEYRKYCIAQDDVLYQERIYIYAFRSQSRKAIKVYRNKAYLLKHVADDELFQSVCIQT